MTDLVKRLRDSAAFIADAAGYEGPQPFIMREAADEIERLNADNRVSALEVAHWRSECDALRVELAETQLLTTRDDYAALERICNEMARDMDALRAELAEGNRVIAETADVRNSWCAEYVKARDERDALQAQVAGLREALEQEREMYRRAKHPDPFKIGIVYTQRDGIRYLLPIVRQWNEYPDVALEVGWCAALAGPTRTADQPSTEQSVPVACRTFQQDYHDGVSIAGCYVCGYAKEEHRASVQTPAGPTK